MSRMKGIRINIPFGHWRADMAAANMERSHGWGCIMASHGITTPGKNQPMNKITNDEYTRLSVHDRVDYLLKRESWLEAVCESRSILIGYAFDVLNDPACMIATLELKDKFRSLMMARGIEKSIADMAPDTVAGFVSAIEAARPSSLVQCKTCGAEDNRGCGCPCMCHGCVVARRNLN